MNLKDSKYDGKGGLWKQHHPKIAAQGNIQIGGRVIALTMWHNDKGGSAPEFTLSINEQKTNHDDIVWFRSLNARACKVGAAPTMTGLNPNAIDPDDDIPF